MRTCPNCGKPLDDDDVFCPECGAKYVTPLVSKIEEKKQTAVALKEPETQYCKFCGKPMISGARFCSACGGDQNSDVKPAAASSTKKKTGTSAAGFLKSKNGMILLCVLAAAVLCILLAKVLSGNKLAGTVCMDEDNIFMFDFQKDGTLVLSYDDWFGAEEYELEWKTSGKKLTLSGDIFGEEFEETVNYEIDGDTLTISGDDLLSDGSFTLYRYE